MVLRFITSQVNVSEEEVIDQFLESIVMAIENKENRFIKKQ